MRGKRVSSSVVIIAMFAAITWQRELASAAEPVKRILIYVEPFYIARTADEAPKVAIGRPHAEQLASTKAEDILKVRDAILANPKLVTPMTMMVLAIRLYDIGQRDESAFWFYAAKDRFRTLTEVATPNVPQLRESSAAMGAFISLAGPVINGYAFCDVSKQKAARDRAIAWVEANPYEVLFMDRLPARKSDRMAALADAIKIIKDDASKERAYLDDPKSAADFAASRKKNDVDVKYCWR